MTQFTPQATRVIRNSFSLSIELLPSCDGVRFKYSDEDEVRQSEIQYDMDGDAYFIEWHDSKTFDMPIPFHVHYLNKFMKH